MSSQEPRPNNFHGPLATSSHAHAASNTTPFRSVAECAKWCASNKNEWKKKCTWSKCDGCPECPGECLPCSVWCNQTPNQQSHVEKHNLLNLGPWMGIRVTVTVATAGIITTAIIGITPPYIHNQTKQGRSNNQDYINKESWIIVFPQLERVIPSCRERTVYGGWRHALLTKLYFSLVISVGYKLPNIRDSISIPLITWQSYPLPCVQELKQIQRKSVPFLNMSSPRLWLYVYSSPTDLHVPDLTLSRHFDHQQQIKWFFVYWIPFMWWVSESCSMISCWWI